MTTEPEHYDLFISDARVDNRDGWIRAFVAALEEEFCNFTGDPERKLQVFWDTEEIPDFAHWQSRIGHDIARSRLFVAFLSPRYFASEICRWEWRSWIEREIGMHILSEGAAPIYIVDIPGFPDQSEQESARLVADLCNLPLPRDRFLREAEALGREFRRRQLHAVQPFYQAGLQALHADDLRTKLRSLAQTINDNSENLRRAAASESTVPAYNPNFTGRIDELVELRNLLVNNSTGVVAGIHGLGGIGKTELAFTFAHAYGGAYPGGRYYVRCDGQPTLAAALTTLERDPFHDEISDNERNREDTNFNAVYRCLKKRIAEKGPVLLVLDNVSEPGLLHPAETGQLTSLGPQLHLLATTRLGEIPGTKRLKLGELKPEEALALLEKSRPFASDEERAAAEQIVERLGGFTMAVELVAAKLSVMKTATYAGVLAGLGLDKLETYAEDDNIQLKQHNDEKRLRAVLSPILTDLSPEADCVLQYAAVMPPDRVTIPWLRDLTLPHFPQLVEPGPDGEDRWVELIHSLFRLSLFSGVASPDGLPPTTRLHRLIGDMLRERPGEDRSNELRQLITKRCKVIFQSNDPPVDCELDNLLEAIPFLLDRNRDRDLAVQGTHLARTVQSRRSLTLTSKLLTTTHQVLKQLAEENREDLSHLRELSVSHNYLGDLAVAQGKLSKAERQYQAALEIASRLSDSDPAKTQWLGDLAVYYNKLGRLAVTQENLSEAERRFHASLAIAKRLSDSDPGNTEWLRYKAVYYNSLGNIEVAQGNLSEAERQFHASLAIAKRLSDSDPGNTLWLRDLAIYYNKLGDIAVAQDNPSAAEQHFQTSLVIGKRLSQSDPGNTEWLRDLAIYYNKAGNLAVAQENLSEAERQFLAALDTFERLSDSDPGNTLWLGDLSFTLFQLGQLFTNQNRWHESLPLMEQGNAIDEQLAALDPTNATWQNDVNESRQMLAKIRQHLEQE